MNQYETILLALANIRNICQTTSLCDAAHEANLLIFEDDGRFFIYSHEFVPYLRDKFSISLSVEELNSILPNIIHTFGTSIEPMHAISNPNQVTYKIYLT